MTLTGCIPDLPDARDYPLAGSKLLGLRPIASTNDLDYRDHLDAVQDQRSNSCVGQSIASASFLCGAIVGAPIARPSALFGYSVGRLRGGPPPLLDQGCRFRDAMSGIRDQGLVAASRWPETPANINAVPPLDAFREGEDATIEAYYRIDDDSPASAGLIAALQRGYCPMFAMLVDAKYAAIGRGIYDGPGGASLGSHAQVIVGYSPIRRAFLVLNSWGVDFGDGGFAWVDERFIDSSTFDRWVIQIAPASVR